MEDSDELEEGISDGDATGGFERLQGSVSKIDNKIDKFELESEDDWHVKTDNAKTFSPALERSEIDSDATYPSWYIFCVYFHNIPSWAWLYSCRFFTGGQFQLK